MSLADFESLLKTSMGLNAASIGSPVIKRAVQVRMSACNLGDLQAYWERVRASDAELQQLIEAVVVPETWFFRDRESFEALARIVHGDWLQAPLDGVLSLLSLPCSTGEEPYSMAMALLDAGLPANRFRIDAVDISARSLAQARRAVYGKNAFRGNELGFRGRHFERTADGYRLNESVRRQVRFQHGNVFAADFLPGVHVYDVIFCRNVLIYFDRAAQDRAILVLQRLLRAKGVLFVAPSETGLPSSHDFVSTKLPLAFAFRKAGAGPRKPKAKAVNPARPHPIRRPAPRVVPTRPATPPTSATLSAAGPSLPLKRSTDTDEATRLADQGHFVEAATCCEEHLRRHGPSAPVFYLLALVRDATGNQSEAGNYYRKALYLEPNHVEAQIHLALLLEKQGDLAGAQVLRNRARRLEQQNKTAHE